ISSPRTARGGRFSFSSSPRPRCGPTGRTRRAERLRHLTRFETGVSFVGGNIRGCRGRCQRSNCNQLISHTPTGPVMPLNRNSKPLAQPASTKQPIRANGVRTQPGGARPSITTAPPAPASGPRARTWKLLMEAAGELVDQGRMPTVAEVAERAGVSRATAYRYFPSRGVLVTAMIDMALGPVRSWESRETDGRKRVHELFRTTFPRFEAFE